MKDTRFQKNTNKIHLRVLAKTMNKLLSNAASNKTVLDLKIRTSFYLKCLWSYL